MNAKYLEWLKSGDTGISSETIFCVMTGTPFELVLKSWSRSTPCDPSDFGRCYRLLSKYPEWLPRLEELRSLGDKWGKFVDNYENMVTLYNEEVPEHTGSAPKLYEFMKTLGL